MAIEQAWYGLVWHPNGTKMYSAGADQNNVQEFNYEDGILTRARTFALPPVSGSSFAGGLAISPDGKALYVTRVFAQSVSSIDLTTGQVLKTLTLPAEPYTCVVSADGRKLYVSLWGGSRVQVYDAQGLFLIEEWTTDEHPSAMLLSADGTRLFIACSNSASVWVFDTFAGAAIEQISMSLFPAEPLTATPNSLALSPDGKTLLVTNGDNNNVAVVDVSNSGRSLVNGFIPTGWYPTGAIFSRDGKQIFMLSGKGLISAAKPVDDGSEVRLQGAVSVLAVPRSRRARRLHAQGLRDDAVHRRDPAEPGERSDRLADSADRGDELPDQARLLHHSREPHLRLDSRRHETGQRRPTLTLFGAANTPNAHALADGFVLFDNFYVDADVSYDGHSFSTSAYATDVIQKMWQTVYGNRGGLYLAEGDGFMRNPFGNLSAPENGYIWDYATRNRVTVRSYGEFVHHLSKSAAGDVVAAESVPGLKGAVAPSFAGFDLDITDNKRVDNWLQEFNAYVQNGALPQLSILHLGNDHTNGTKPGAPTPRAMMADNDLALGRVVEAVSNSVYWKDSAIFVLEDDAQSGPDHVDSHRSVALVASPFAKRGFVDHTFYSTSGVLRTMELVLGLPPMSHYDAAAPPLVNAFQGTPVLTAYRRLTPAFALDEKNPANAAGAALSRSMDFSDADLTPEEPLNEVIWQSVKGPDSKMPPPRRSVFVRP